MNFGRAIATCFRKYVDFRGHASRPEYWWFTLFTVIVSIVTASLDSALKTDVLNNLWSLAVLLPGLAVSVRRLRDAGYAWPWMFIVLVPLAGAIVLIVLLCRPTLQRVAVPAWEAYSAR